MNIEHLRNNDNFAQCIRNLNRNEEQNAQVKEQIKTCEHLFVKVKGEEYYGSNHSSDCETTIPHYECVKCGLTNKFEEIEELLSKDDFIIKNDSDVTLETKTFYEYFHDLGQPIYHWYRADLPLMSDDVIRTWHPGLLYRLALIINPDATKEELFEIMKYIKEQETSLENLKLSTVEEAQELLNRCQEKAKIFSITKHKN